MSSTPVEYTVWLCPTPFQFPGICFPLWLDDRLVVGEGDNDVVEVMFPLCPSGYDCSVVEVEVYIKPDDKSEIDCLYCIPACDSPYQPQSATNEFQRSLLKLLNLARVTRKEDCQGGDCPELKLVADLTSMAQWFADDMIAGDYYADDHVDRWGRDLKTRFDVFGCSYVTAAENLAEVIMIDEDKGPSELAQVVFDGWMNSPGHRANILTGVFNEVGIGLGHTRTLADDEDSVQNRYIVVTDFAEREDSTEELDLPEPELNCISECVENLVWNQEYDEVSGWENVNGELQPYTRRDPKPFIDFEAPIPNMCGLRRLRLKFEVSPCSAVWEPSQDITDSEAGEFEEGSGLKLIWSGVIGDKWTTRWHLSGSACFVPGEWIAVTAEFDLSDSCNPAVIAFGWFETQCWTSGKFVGCGLLADDGTVVEGGYGEDMDDDWVGDERLRWLVEYKGDLFWLRSSDFAKYSLGERAFIFKGGYSYVKGPDGDVETRHGCRWPVGIGGITPSYNEVLSYSNVTYKLNPSTDVIVPQTFWGYGG